MGAGGRRFDWLSVPRDFPEHGPFFTDPTARLIRGGASQRKQDVVIRAILHGIGEANRQFVVRMPRPHFVL